MRGVLGFTVGDGLIVGDDLSDGESRAVTYVEEVRRGIEGVEPIGLGISLLLFGLRQRGGSGDTGTGTFARCFLHGGAIHDEATADGVVLGAAGQAGAMSVPCVENEAVRVLFDGLRVEPELVIDAAVRAADGAFRRNWCAGCGFHSLICGERRVTHQPQQDSAVSAVAHAGSSEGTTQLNMDFRGEFTELFHEGSACSHWTHGV